MDELRRAQAANPAAAPVAPKDEGDLSKATILERPKREVDRGPTPFEAYANSVLSQDRLRRFGSDLVRDEADTFLPSVDYAIPSDYVIGPGDTLLVRTWGSVEGQTSQVVDRRGKVTLPTVGEIDVSGVRYDQLEPLMRSKYARYFKDFKVSVALQKLRGIRVHVTGFAANPGTYSVSNLSTLLNVFLASGGPDQSGSFRSVSLYRDGREVSTLDVYAFLINGDRSKDVTLRAGDVIRVSPAGPQVAIAGAVRRPAVYELMAGETVLDLLEMAGQFTELAETGFLRLLEVDKRQDGFGDVPLRSSGQRLPRPGDLYLALNSASYRVPTQRQALRIRIEGEVVKPGNYLLTPGATLEDAVMAAGGLSPGAYLYGAVLARPSVRTQQRQQLLDARREMERLILAEQVRQDSNSPDEAQARQRQLTAAQQLLARTEDVDPIGRIILPIQPSSSRLPLLDLEDGDQFFVPPIPGVVGVYGSVGSPGTFLFDPALSPDRLLDRAGGPQPTADMTRLLVVRANGQTQRVGQDKVLGVSLGKREIAMLPGDAVFVPEDLSPRFNLIRELRDWSQVIGQFAIGAASIKVLRD
jgi:protein involved in polysaccharide export with SLBB domain